MGEIHPVSEAGEELDKLSAMMRGLQWKERSGGYTLVEAMPMIPGTIVRQHAACVVRDEDGALLKPWTAEVGECRRLVALLRGQLEE
jgi:hypothetical protein